MSIGVQRRRGTTLEHEVFVGENGEITIDTDKKTVVVHDGSTAGGFPLARENRNQRILDPFKQGKHQGLVFAYEVGAILSDINLIEVPKNTLLLDDNSINYIEVSLSGIVSSNITGFSKNNIPLYKVATLNSVISSTQDYRCFINTHPEKHDASIINQNESNRFVTDIEKNKWSQKCFSLYVDDILEVGTKFISVISPYNLQIKNINLSVDSAPVGSDLIVDINLNGITLYTIQDNRPRIIINETSAIATLPDIININAGDKISLDIDQIGSSSAGENLSVTILCEVI